MDRLQPLTQEDLTRIHDSSIEILTRSGICFNSPAALELFKHHGFKTDGKLVFFNESEILKALETTCSRFTILARNPEKNLFVGEGDFICLPTGGPPNIAEPDGTQRPAVLKDYLTCCKLVQMSDQVDMGGYFMVQTTDSPPETAHLDMMANYVILCDKPIFGASGSHRSAVDTLKMAQLVWGGEEALQDKLVVIAVVDSMSPLQYTGEQVDVIMEMSRHNQALVFTNMILAGASGPVSLPGLLALGNAENLAGITFSQLIRPGVPVVYGSTSSQMDMKTMVGTVGTPEAVAIASATIQLARFYNLPCRTGGGLTDAHMPDGQAMAESALMLSTAIRGGANFIYHAFGQMGAYISMSFEKWIMDEEVVANIRRILTPMVINHETIDTDTICQLGIGGQYLTHPSTFKEFKTLSQPMMFNRKDYQRWKKDGGKSAAQAAGLLLEKRLASYEKPDIDPALEKDIQAFVKKRKGI
jgi:trimethylamine--corrinoid protein Co-methyltransferase